MKKNIFDSIKLLNLQNNLITISPSTNKIFTEAKRNNQSSSAYTLWTSARPNKSKQKTSNDLSQWTL